MELSMRTTLAALALLAAPAAGAAQEVASSADVALQVPAAAPAATTEASADEGDPVAYSVRATTLAGKKFTGVAMRTPRLDELFQSGDQQFVDTTTLPADMRIELRHFNGLNGSMTVRAGELRELELLDSLSDPQLKGQTQAIIDAKAAKWAAEAERLKIVSAERESRAQAAVDEAAAAAPVEDVIPPQFQVWLDKFPPDQGWIPAKKSQLYYQSVVLNSRPLTDQERDWLDNFDAWKVGYDYWLAAEQKKTAAEEAAKAAGAEPPTGAAKPEPSGTGESGGSTIDPDHPTAADQKVLPPPIDPAAPKPDKVDPSAPKPAGLEKDAPKPANLENGGRPTSH